MIQLDLLARFRLLAEAYRLQVPAAEGPREVTPATQVQQVTGTVEGRLADGNYRVLAGGQRFDVELPAPARPGDRVQLELPAAASAASPERQPPPSARSDVSWAGRLVAQLVAQLPEPRAPGTISAAQPLLPDAPVNTGSAVASLRELVGLSGLFYESHQAEWVSGERDTQQLRREPQARIDPSSAQAPPGQPIQLHPDAAPLVQQQINALEARHILWSGEIWPGQPMRWEIEDAAKRTPGDADPAHLWRTRVDLHLPRLGAVTALFTLGAGGVGLRLHAQSQSTDALFGQRLPELRAALAGAGLQLAEIVKDARARA